MVMPMPLPLDLEVNMRVKKNIEALKPYEVMMEEDMIKLDANESGYQMSQVIELPLNRYPDDRALDLKKALAAYLAVNSKELIIGNGSSEMIELLFRTYLEKGEQVLGFSKSFSMYKIFAQIYEADYIGIENDYVMDMDVLIEAVVASNPKMVMLCNPNNPTGYLIKKQDIERLLKVYSGLVVVDEAYIEFTEGSMLNRLGDYQNLVILRTFSKAWGLAGARVGYMIASEQIVNAVLKVKPPYNLNMLSQQAALNALKQREKMKQYVQKTIALREKVYDGLIDLNMKAYKSSANFIYFEADENLGDQLKIDGILIRSFGGGKYRVTIGTEDEINAFLNALEGQVKS